MNLFQRIVLIILLVVFQTTGYYFIPELKNFVNLTCSFVVYAVLFLPFGEGLFLILLLGFLLDSVTSGPFGLYISVYLWILVGFRPFVTMLNLKNIHALQFLTGIAIIFENVVFFAVTSFLKPETVLSSHFIKGMVFQFLWTVALSPFLIRFLNAMDLNNKTKVQSE